MVTMGDVCQLHLTQESHGSQCFRGEISLTFDELSILQNHISPDFRFVPVDEKSVTQPPTKKTNTRYNAGPQLVSPLTTGPIIEDKPSQLSPEEDRKRRTKKPSKYDFNENNNKPNDCDNTNQKQITTVPLNLKTKETKKSVNQKTTKEISKATTTNADYVIYNVPTPNLTSANLQDHQKDPIIQFPKLIVPTQIWIATCKRIIEDLKKKEEASWFLLPVIPERDGVWDYLDIITHPMDFKTVETKLNKGIYRSSYEWQQDMRQIFYNAFKYHIVHNKVWHDAMKLAKEFKALIHGLPEISIYSRFSQPIQTLVSSTHPSKTSQHPNNGQALVHDPEQPPHNEIRKPPKSSTNIYNNFPPSAPINTGSDSYLKEPSIPRSDDPLTTYQIPAVGNVPKPPPEQKIGINDKSLTNYQRKLLLQNLSRLAPNQRFAALELIQDDLGILAETHASDTNFKFDIELLSIEKQKRIHIYVNQMARENTEMINQQNSQKQIFIPSTNDPTPITKKRKRSNNSFENNQKLEVDQSDTSYSSSSFISSSSSDTDSSPDYERDTLEFGKDNTSTLSSPAPVTTKKRKNSLPEYTPISEQDTAFQINEEIMGKHADFLGRMDTSSTKSYHDNSNDSKVSAWADWKGQVIKQGVASQREGAPTRSRDEIIAESYDARI